MKKILMIITIIILLLIFGCTYEIELYPSSPKQVDERPELGYNEQGVSTILWNRIISHPHQMDCTNLNNYDNSSLFYEFYVESKWIPSTNEGRFTSRTMKIENNGCTNLFLEQTVYIIFNFTVLTKFTFPCSEEPLRPTQDSIASGMFRPGVGLIVNQTGEYIVQTEFTDCEKNITLIKRAVVVDMGNINQDFYNKVDYITPVDIKR